MNILRRSASTIHSSSKTKSSATLLILMPKHIELYSITLTGRLFTLEEYCDFIADCLELLPPSMVVHRITGDGPRALLLAPRWSTDKKRVLNTIRKRLQERKTYQGSKFQS